MSSRSVKRLVCTLSVFFLFSALASGPVQANDEDEFEFTGVISSLPSTAGFVGDWVVGNRTVHVTSSTRIEQDDGSPAVGKTVDVEGVLQQDGSVNATDIEVKSSTETTSEFLFRGRVETLPATTGFIGDWVVSGRTIHVTSSTMIQQVEAPLAVGVPVKVIGSLRTDGTIDATKIQTEKVEHTTFFEFTGAVQTLPGTSNLIGDWMIGGRVVHVTSATQIDTDGGAIRVGTVVQVKGTVRTDGSIDAVKIEPVEASQSEFSGIISNLPNTTGFVGDWVVGGRTIHVTSSTLIHQEEGLVAIGAFVEIRGAVRSDGSIDATLIEVEHSAGNERPVPSFELHGTVEQLPNTPGLIGDWTISGRIVHVTSATIIRAGTGAISVGTFVEVEGNLRTDNTIDASSIEVEHARGNATLTPFFALFGTVEMLPTTTNFVGDWVVSGRTIHVTSSTQILTAHRPLVLGSFVRIVGTLRTDGSIDARMIQVKRSDNMGHSVNFFELFGTVQMTPSSGIVGDYQISGLTVHTTSSTHFAPAGQTIAVGARVKVVGTLRSDGSLDATAIVVEGNVDDAHDFVTTQYDDFLNRAPDDAGLQFWVNEINRCGNDANCIAAKRINVSAAFFLSTEFQNTGFLVERLYVASFQRVPRLEEFVADTQTIGEGVIVNQPGWQQQLENNKQAFFDDWVQHPSFVATFGGLTNTQFIDALLAHTGFTLTASQRTALIAGLDNGTLTRGDALRQIVEDQGFANHEFNRAFVLMQYFGYLRRNPDDAPDGNLSGFNFWLNKLNQFNGNYVSAEMVKAFIQSSEYRNRFAH